MSGAASAGGGKKLRVGEALVQEGALSEEQLKQAPSFYGEGQLWPDRTREQAVKDYWNALPRV